MSKQLTPKQQYWSDIVANAEDSSLSLADFAKEHQLNPKDLYRWRNRLKSLPEHAEPIQPVFSQVLPTAISAQPSLSISTGQSQLQFNTLPDPQWLATFLNAQGASV